MNEWGKYLEIIHVFGDLGHLGQRHGVKVQGLVGKVLAEVVLLVRRRLEKVAAHKCCSFCFIDYWLIPR